MKKPLLISLFTALSALTFGQSRLDSAQQKIDSLTERITASLPQLPDSLLPAFYKVDSIRMAFNQEADSIKTQFQSAVSWVDTKINKLNSSIDSLSRLRLPTEKYTGKLDSLNQLRQKTVSKFNAKLADLKSKTTGKLNALDLPPEYKEPLQQLTKNIDDLSFNNEVFRIPSLEIPGFSMPKIDDLDDLTSKVGEIANAADLNLPKLETPVGDLGGITEKVKAYQEDIKSIAGGNLEDVKELPDAIEQKAGDLAGVDELEKQSGVFDGYKSQLDILKGPKSGKEKAVEMAKKIAVDHFAGKEEKLKAAMQQMAKYKQKYSSVSSIKDLPKRPPNPMKGKPFIERLIPGLYFQYQQKNYNLFDLNPYLGYRISGRFTAGAGWNQRLAYDRRTDSWSEKGAIFGPRAYVDCRLGKGFIAHLESEVMNTFVPSVLNGNPEVGYREWVWGMMTGMKKEYKIYKNIRGTVLLQYNLFNPKYKAPYVDRLNSRIGFEYLLKKKERAGD